MTSPCQPSRHPVQAASIRLVLVDDSAELRSLMSMLFRLEPGIEVVAEAGDGRSGLEAAVDHQADVVITDIRMPVMDGIELTSALHNRQPSVRVVVITGLPDPDAERRALEAGADAFMEKATELDGLVALVRDVRQRRDDSLQEPTG